MTDIKDINPKNKPYLRRVRAENQPLGYGSFGLDQVGERNRKTRRAYSRWAARPKNKVVLRKAAKTMARTMLQGDHTGPASVLEDGTWTPCTVLARGPEHVTVGIGGEVRTVAPELVRRVEG